MRLAPCVRTTGGAQGHCGHERNVVHHLRLDISSISSGSTKWHPLDVTQVTGQKLVITLAQLNP